MKLATMRDGSRDGQLVVVSRDLTQAHYASGIANHLQQVLDDWNFLAPQLQELSAELEAGRTRHAFAFDAALCLAPLPRASAWARCAPYPGHARRCPERAHAGWHQEAGAPFLPPVARWASGEEVAELDFLAGWAMLTADLPRASAPEQVLERVRLLTLVVGLVQARDSALLASAFAPVVLTPDELGDAWHAGQLHLGLQVQLNARKVGLCDMGEPMQPALAQSLAELVGLRPWPVGGLLGALPVSNGDAAKGFCSLAEKRAVEAAERGEPATAWLRAGDALRVEARRAGGAALFGAIELRID